MTDDGAIRFNADGVRQVYVAANNAWKNCSTSMTKRTAVDGEYGCQTLVMRVIALEKAVEDLKKKA